MVLKITLKPKRGSGKLAKRIGDEIDLSDDAVAQNLVSQISASAKLSADRIRLTVKSNSGPKDRVLQRNESLKSITNNGALTVYYRDLGPQVAWRTVFIVEYLGPMLLHILLYNNRRFVYGEDYVPTTTQVLTYVCVLLHFLKREYETVYVHKFSLSTMPLFNLFKNSTHYWLLSGVLIAYFGYAPKSWWTGDAPVIKKVLFHAGGVMSHSSLTAILALVWFFAEVSNFIVHRNLSSLRPAGTTERRIPYGYGFLQLSCPNYFFESCSWIALTLMTGNWAMLLFTVVGTVQMYFWALKKHRRYLQEFPEYPKNRRAMFPFLA